MLRSLNTGISGLQQFQMQIDVVGNNIANVNTTGFKTGRTNFEDSFSQALSGTNTQVGSGVNMAAISNNFNQGAVTSTAVGTDLAIAGEGFFMVRNPIDSSLYATRAGDFRLDSTGYLVSNDGLRVQGYNDSALGTIGDLMIDATGSIGASAIPPTTVASYNIDRNGIINVTMSDGEAFQRGQVLLQDFRDPSQLMKEGNNLYSGMAGAGPSGLLAPQTNGLGIIQSGALELSNVDLTVEMSNLIVAQRAFQANARIITTSDEIMQEVVNLKR